MVRAAVAAGEIDDSPRNPLRQRSQKPRRYPMLSALGCNPSQRIQLIQNPRAVPSQLVTHTTIPSDMARKSTSLMCIEFAASAMKDMSKLPTSIHMKPPPSTSILFASWWHLRITTSQAVYPNPHCAVNAGAGVYPTLHRRVYSIPSHQVRFLIAARLRPSKHPAIPCVRIVPALLLRPHMTQACLRVSRNVPRCCPPCFSWYKNL